MKLITIFPFLFYLPIILSGTITVNQDLNISFTFELIDTNTSIVSFKMLISAMPFWVSAGFGNNGMSKMDVWVAEFLNITNYNLYDMYSTSYLYPFMDTDIGGTYDFKNISYTSDSDHITLSFIRDLYTNDILDYEFTFPPIINTVYTINYTDMYYQSINSNKSVNLYNFNTLNLSNEKNLNMYLSTDLVLFDRTNYTFYLAYGNGSLNYHGANYTICNLIIYDNYTVSIIEQTHIKYPSTFFIISASIFLFSWIIANFFGIYSAAYLKYHVDWIYIHTILSGGSAFLTIIIGLIGLKYASDYNYEQFGFAGHITLGEILIILCFIQLATGTAIYLVINKFNPNTGLIHKVKYIHHFLGYSISIVSYICAMTGISNSSNNMAYIPLVYISIISVVIIYIVIRRYYHLENKNKIESILVSSDERREKIFYFSRDEIHDIKVKKKIVFFDNYIVDVEKFIDYHPGGKIHLIKNLGSDISRYLCGSLSVNPNFEPHYHSLNAHRHLIENLVVGVFRENSGIIVTTDSKDVIVSPNSKTEFLNLQFFDLPIVWISSRIINVHVSEIRFTLKRNLQNYRFNRFLPGYRWTGRHYSVSSKKLNKTRLYSVCLVLDETVFNYHRILIDNLSKLQIKDNIIPPQMKPNEILNDYLQIYVKKYEVPNALSKYIHEFSSRSEEDDFFAKGPIGFGMDLEPKLEGVYLAFGGGTGVLCFLDFIAYILRYIADRVAENLYGEKNNKIMLDEDFSPISPDFKLIFFSAFKDKFSTIFQELCERMHFFSEKYGFLNSVFKYYVRIAKNQPQKWDKNFLSQELSIHKEKIKKVYICGTSDFIQDITIQVLESNLVEKDKIFLI